MSSNFQKKRWIVRVINTLILAAFILLIVFNAKEMPAWLIVLICVAAVLLVYGGRIFCGYFCPNGLLLDLFYWISQKLHIRRIKRSERFNRFISGFKWFFLVFYTVLHFVLGFDPGWFLVVLLVVSSPFIARFWCTFCPVGTLLGLCNRLSPMKLVKKSEGCVSCKACYRYCPMQSKKVMMLKKEGPTNSGDCIFCGECIDKCPGEGTISLHLFGKTIHQSHRRKGKI